MNDGIETVDGVEGNGPKFRAADRPFPEKPGLGHGARPPEIVLHAIECLTAPCGQVLRVYWGGTGGTLSQGSGATRDD